MRKLATIIDQIKNLDNNLPHNTTRQDRQHKYNQHIKLKRDIACAHSYSFEDKQCGQDIDIPVITASEAFSNHPTDTNKSQRKAQTMGLN